MTTAVAIQPLAVVGCGVVSHAGYGLAPLGELLRAGAAGPAEPAGPDAGDYPPRAVRTVPEFKVADHLGRKGNRYLDRLTSFGLVACKQVLEEVGAPETAEERARTGVVMATNTGSVSSHSALLHDTLAQEKPYQLNPAQFPNTVMNCAAGQMAIRNKLKGLNATVAGGQTAGLFAFRHARIAMALGRADRLLVGGAEELSGPAAWAWHRTGVLTEQAALGEGCAVFVVEEPGEREPLALLLGCEVGYFGPSAEPAGQRHSLSGGLALVIERALERSGVRPEEIDTVSLGATHHIGLDRVEERGVRAALGGALPSPVRVGEVLGETYSAAGALQLAALLALWAGEPAGPRTGLVTSVGHDGNAGALVVRRA
ncbi:beta-ketoacyl synthase N-terminal-like domain-containing protein [Kitasatospora atroaurantiaca]|uniref:3-oxoacyl-[acyl-carrier-protein] synthase II n=1 Tax=Kitasatospora atroaurantiaca TaxID=285545 RepID=A0A561ENW2_9ACTN|nr:beta-ketoacyl synthase N-terminal-like domain-containing protein [Kitasatospora atroaurantiaca]TWE17249.1 3-oxoacyl-[acyl-carrier-protein] synthase II [Kitasatospora atroaurantiaca]